MTKIVKFASLFAVVLFAALAAPAMAAGFFPWAQIRDLPGAPAWTGSGCFGPARGGALNCVSRTPVDCSIGVGVDASGHPTGWINQDHRIPGWTYKVYPNGGDCGGDTVPNGHGRWVKAGR